MNDQDSFENFRWVKYYPKILDTHPLRLDSHAFHLWYYLLGKATWRRRQVRWNGDFVFLEPGQLITGRLEMAANTGISPSKVWRLMEKFEELGQIGQQKTNLNTLVTIINWSKYQGSEQPVNNNRTTNGQQTNNKRTLLLEGIEGEERLEGLESPYSPPRGAVSPLQLRIGAWFSRRPTTAWSAKELKALEAIGDPHPEDLALLESYYLAEGRDLYRRKDIVTLLNNWNTEADRARGWANGRSNGEAKPEYTNGLF